MRWYFIFLFCLMATLTSCVKDEPLVIEKAQQPSIVFAEELLLKPQVFDNKFYMATANESGSFLTSIDKIGNLEHISTLESFLPAGATVDTISGADVYLQDRTLYAAFTMKGSPEGRVDSELTYRITSRGATGNLNWSFESKLLYDGNLQECNMVGVSMKTDTVVLAFLHIYGQLESQLMFIGFDNTGFPVDTTYSDVTKGVFSPVKATNGKFYTCLVSYTNFQGNNVFEKMFVFNPRMEIERVIELPFFRFFPRLSYINGNEIYLLGTEVEAFDESEQALLHISANNTVSKKDIPDNFTPKVPIFIQGMLHLVGANSQQGWSMEDDELYSSHPSKFAIWNTETTDNTRITSIESENSIVPQGAMVSDDGNLVVLSAISSFKKLNEIQIMKISTDGEFVE